MIASIAAQVKSLRVSVTHREAPRASPRRGTSTICSAERLRGQPWANRMSLVKTPESTIANILLRHKS